MTFVLIGALASVFTVCMFVMEAVTNPKEPFVRGWMFILAVVFLSTIGRMVHFHCTVSKPARIAERKQVENKIRVTKAEAAKAAKVWRAERLAKYPWLTE